jgi:hypothetical protein
MTKRRPAFDDRQMDMGFGVPEAASTDGALASLPRETASAVGAILRGDSRSRYEVAAAVSGLLEADVSKLMLDAYSSEGREDHNIGFARMLVLIAATRRFDVLRSLLRRIGCDLLVGEEVYLAEIGHLEAQRRAIETRLKTLKSVAEPMTGGRRK